MTRCGNRRRNVSTTAQFQHTARLVASRATSSAGSTSVHSSSAPSGVRSAGRCACQPTSGKPVPQNTHVRSRYHRVSRARSRHPSGAARICATQGCRHRGRPAQRLQRPTWTTRLATRPASAACIARSCTAATRPVSGHATMRIPRSCPYRRATTALRAAASTAAAAGPTFIDAPRGRRALRPPRCRSKVVPLAKAPALRDAPAPGWRHRLLRSTGMTGSRHPAREPPSRAEESCRRDGGPLGIRHLVPPLLSRGACRFRRCRRR